MDQKIYSIYKITNTINGKLYIGFTSQNPPEKRFKQHCNMSPSRTTLITNSIKKHGKENFIFEVILQGRDMDDVLRMETYFIEHYNTLSPNGYNLNIGGSFTILSEKARQNIGLAHTGRHHSKESKLKISKASIGSNNGMYGKQHSERSKELMSNKLKEYYSSSTHPRVGKKHSEETKLKQSLAQKGRKHSYESILKMSKVKIGKNGRKHSEETKAKMSIDRRGRKFSEQAKENMSKGKTGEKNVRTARCKVKLPSGKIESVVGITKFCRQHGINRNMLREQSRLSREYYGYIIIN